MKKKYENALIMFNMLQLNPNTLKIKSYLFLKLKNLQYKSINIF